MPAESHEVSTAADLASQVRARRVDPVATTSAALARIAGDSRALAAFRRVRRDEALAEAAALADRSDLGELALAGVPVAVKEVAAIAGEHPAWESPSTTQPFAFDSDVVEHAGSEQPVDGVCHVGHSQRLANFQRLRLGQVGRIERLDVREPDVYNWPSLELRNLRVS